MLVWTGEGALALALAGVWVEGFPRAALFHPCTFTAACLIIEALVVRAGGLVVAFALAGLEVEPLVRRAVCFHTARCAGARLWIVNLPMCTTGSMNRAHT